MTTDQECDRLRLERDDARAELAALRDTLAERCRSYERGVTMRDELLGRTADALAAAGVRYITTIDTASGVANLAATLREALDDAERLRAVIVEYLDAGAAHDEAAKAMLASDTPPLWRRQADAAQRWHAARLALIAVSRR